MRRKGVGFSTCTHCGDCGLRLRATGFLRVPFSEREMAGKHEGNAADTNVPYYGKLLVLYGSIHRVAISVRMPTMLGKLNFD